MKQCIKISLVKLLPVILLLLATPLLKAASLDSLLADHPAFETGTGPESMAGPAMEIRNLPQENLYVHTDRDIYFAGDRMFFKAYLATSQENGYPLQSHIVYLSLVGESGEHLSKLEMDLEGRSTHGSIRIADTLQTGIYRLSAWTNNMLIAEIPPFAKQLTVINRFDQDIRGFILENSMIQEPGEQTVFLGSESFTDDTTSVGTAGPLHGDTTAAGFLLLKTEKSVYGPRETVRLELTGGEDLPGPASASLTVTREEAFLLNSPTITDWLRDPIHGHANGQAPESEPGMLVLPENLGSVVSGRVIDNGSGRPLSNALVYLSAIDSLTNLKYSRTRTDGSFFFLLDDYYRGKTIHLSVFETDDPGAAPRIELREKFAPMPFVPEKMSTHSAIHAYMEEALLVKQVQRSYRTGDFGLVYREGSAPVPVPPLLYGSPTHKIYTRDYLPLDNLTEMSIEIVPNLRIRRQAGTYSTRMINSRSAVFFPDPPVFFMNGVWLPEIDKIAGLSSDEITRIEVLSRPWLYGDLQFSGIVGIFTMDDLHSIPAGPTTKIIQATPLAREVAVSPNPHTQGANPHIPDYRETLFWDPEIKLQPGSVQVPEFTTSDLPGRYFIVLQGLSDSGMPFQQTTTIIVE